ncbi:MAG: hypothetical protein WA130_19635 [Candidatus Methanoperedens sp.]
MSEITLRFAEGMPSVWNSGWINRAGNLVAGTDYLRERIQVLNYENKPKIAN